MAGAALRSRLVSNEVLFADGMAVEGTTVGATGASTAVGCVAGVAGMAEFTGVGVAGFTFSSAAAGDPVLADAPAAG